MKTVNSFGHFVYDALSTLMLNKNSLRLKLDTVLIRTKNLFAKRSIIELLCDG